MHRGDIDRPRRRGRAAYGSAIRSARVGRGETQASLARRVGISQGALSKIERGECNVTPHTRALVAAVLGADVDALCPQPRRRRRRPAGENDEAPTAVAA